MLKELSIQDKRTNVVYFYIGSISSLLLVTGILAVFLLKKEGYIVQIAAIGAVVLLILLFHWYLKKRTKRMKDLIGLIEK